MVINILGLFQSCLSMKKCKNYKSNLKQLFYRISQYIHLTLITTKKNKTFKENLFYTKIVNFNIIYIYSTNKICQKIASKSATQKSTMAKSLYFLWQNMIPHEKTYLVKFFLNKMQYNYGEIFLRQDICGKIIPIKSFFNEIKY